MTWEIVAGIITLVGFMVTILGLFAKLIGTLARLDETIKHLQETIAQDRDDNKAAHDLLFKKTHAHSEILDNHELRIHDLERKG